MSLITFTYRLNPLFMGLQQTMETVEIGCPYKATKMMKSDLLLNKNNNHVKSLHDGFVDQCSHG